MNLSDLFSFPFKFHLKISLESYAVSLNNRIFLLYLFYMNLYSLSTYLCDFELIRLHVVMIRRWLWCLLLLHGFISLKLAPVDFPRVSQMSEASRRSRVTITLGRSGQVVNRAVSDLDADYELPRVGTKRSVKERLGIQLDSSVYGSDEVVSKRQRGESSFSGNDLQIGQNDLRLKLMRKNAQRQAQNDEGSTMDLREKLSRSKKPSCSLDTRPRMAEPRDAPLSRAARDSSRMISSCNSSSPWALEDLRKRSPERFVDKSRGPTALRNVSGVPRAPSPRINAGRTIATPRDLSPRRYAEKIISSPRDRSPRRNAGKRIGSPRDLSLPRSFTSGSRDPSPTRKLGSYMGSQAFSPPMNRGSYMDSTRGSPPRSNVEDFHGQSRMRDDVRISPYGVRGLLNGQVATSGVRLVKPMLPPPVPNPHPLPPLSQLPPLGSMMQNRPFSVEAPVESFLKSIGLGRYTHYFQKEEVDMATIKQMNENDLKELKIPMGPRKKILQAIASLPTW